MPLYLPSLRLFPLFHTNERFSLYSHPQLRRLRSEIVRCKKEKNEANEIVQRVQEQTMKEKQDFDQLAEGLQQQMMTAVTVAVQKLEKANHKIAALERQVAELI
jgi:polyhydroxyalkanoate synthesis regulator phasin